MDASSVHKHCLQYRIVFLGVIQLFILILRIVIDANEIGKYNFQDDASF
jgi:hypothetical protein